MSDWHVGLSTGCFYLKSIFECLDSIRASGFSQIEVCSSPAHLDYHDIVSVRRVTERLSALGIEPYSFHAPFAAHIDITSPDTEKRDRSLKEVLAAVEAAAVLHARYFVIHPGPEETNLPLGEERTQRLANASLALGIVAERCWQLGMMCVLENKLPHLLFGDIRDMMWILGAMKTTHVGICLDTGHAHLAGDLWNAPHKLATSLKMIHASDNKGRHDDHLPPGEGEIDWLSLFRQLHVSGFQGSIIVEIAGEGEAHHILDSAQRAHRFLRDSAWDSLNILRREQAPTSHGFD